MHGASFCAFMHSKANATTYFQHRVVGSSVASLTNAVANETAGVEVSLPGVIKSLFFSMALGIYVILAYRVNYSTRYHRQGVARISVLQKSMNLRSRGHHAVLSRRNWLS